MGEAKNSFICLIKVDKIMRAADEAEEPVEAKRESAALPSDFTFPLITIMNLSGCEPLSPKFRKWYNSYDGETTRPYKSESCQVAFMQRSGDYREGNGPSISCTSASNALSYLCEFPKTAEES